MSSFRKNQCLHKSKQCSNVSLISEYSHSHQNKDVVIFYVTFSTGIITGYILILCWAIPYKRFERKKKK